MWHWTPFCLLAVASIACSSKEPGSAKDRAPIRTPATARTNERTSAPLPEPVAAEGDRPDAGAPQPQLAALALGRPMLLDFTRKDCLPCKLMEPWLADLRRRHTGVIEILEVDLDLPENRDVARFFKARSVPMQVYVDTRGAEVSRNVGLATLPQMQRRLEKLGFLEPAKK
jgi:thioredoxin 1